MAKRRRCPPVASRGVFRYLTYLIPVEECASRSGSGQNFFYWAIVQLKKGAFQVWNYMSLVPIGGIVSHLHNINFSSAIVNTAVSQISFFYNVIKPSLDKLIQYFSRPETAASEEVDAQLSELESETENTKVKPESVEVGGSAKPAIVKPVEVEPVEAKDSFLSISKEVNVKKVEKEKFGVDEVDTEEVKSDNVWTRLVQPFKYVFSTMRGFLAQTGNHISSGGCNAYNYLANCPPWVFAYITFILVTVSYIAYQTYVTYRGRIWAQENKVSAEIREGCKEFILSDTTLKQVMSKMRAEIDKGLDPKTKSSSSVKCFTTYVQDLPTGNENGRFLALDLGGTNFRVLLITLNGKHFDMQSKIYAIPQDVMVGTSQNLFKHIAQCLVDFTKEHKVNKDNLPLGFTFSFPLKQVGLTKGILQHWTKGFNCPEAVGKDVVQLLGEAIEAHGDMKIDIMAILNDTTGTLMSCAWKNHNCKIGVILGTGTNACYIEKIENVIDFDGDKSKPNVLINTEWGAFGDNGELEFIITPYDKEVDKKSINPGLQKHEKLISGMYLGEIVRLLLVKFISDKLLFSGKLNEEIQKSDSIPTKFLSEIESDKRGVFKNCRKALEKIGYTEVNDEDCNSVRYICECVSRRAAHLASAGLATLINKMGFTSLTIGVDGSLYRYHPHFHDLMVEKISQLIDDKIMNVNLMLSEDGSGRGAALVAASLV